MELPAANALSRLREREGEGSRPATKVLDQPSPLPSPASRRGSRWGIVVDVNRCVGCQTCVTACKHQNETAPAVQWRRVLDVETGTYPDVARLFLVTGCQHCAEPPCVPVCPTGATTQRADGFVMQDYATCIGCGYCAVACPYDARTIAHETRAYYGDAGLTRQEKAAAHPERDGVVQKCTFCVGKVDDGIAAGLVPGVDAAATPACVSSCIADALHFGDFDDPRSNVATLMREKSSVGLNEELGTKPSIRYVYETPAVPGRDANAEPDEERMADLANPLVGKLQPFWDYRAAMNFTLGGLGAGLAVAGYLAMPETRLLLGFFIAAGIAIATGLLFVFFEIGRKERFLLALRRPHTSWMTREIYAVAAFYLLLAVDLIAPAPLLHGLVALAALGFLYCQARILHAGKGIPAWRAPLIPPMLVASGLAEGAGAAALIAAAAAAEVKLLAGLGLVLAAANAFLWHRYRRTAEERRIGVLARRAIAHATPPLHFVAHALPALCFAAALMIPSPLGGFFAAAGGMLAAAGGAFWKFVVITLAAYRQDIVLPKLPRRGSGTRAAPTMLRPAAAE